MSTISYSRQASPDEMAAEIDRRGHVIEGLEAERDRLAESERFWKDISASESRARIDAEAKPAITTEAAGRVTEEDIRAALADWWAKLPVAADELVGIVSKLIEAAPKPPHMPAGRWQPIETAPKDGTRILLLGLPNEAQGVLPQIATGHWRKFSGSRYPGAWCWVHSVGPSFKITHWMSAPPPAPSEKGGR